MSGDAQKILLSMTCPACGGQVECEEGEELVICKFCDSVFKLIGDEGAGKVMYKSAINGKKALNSVKEWFKTGPKAKDLPDKFELTECYPIYLPFWRLVARGKACVCGIEIQKGDKDESDKRIPREALINREYIYTDLACDVGDLGIPSIRIPKTAQAIPFDDSGVVTFGVTESRSDAYREGCEKIEFEAIADGISAASLDEYRFTKAFVFPKAFTLAYYPVWVVRYKYEDRDYFAAVDGVTSKILSGRAPGDAGKQSTSAGVGGAISGAALGAGVGLSFPLTAAELGELVPVSIIAGIIICVAVFAYFYNRFRYGDEILEGDIEGKGVKTKNAAKNIEFVYSSSYDYVN